jgi:hypothetical protein
LCENERCADIQIAHAIPKLNVEAGRSPYFFLPLPLQVDMDTSTVKRLLVHGPRGISKSVGGRMYIYSRARKIAGYRGLLLRCTYDQLKKNHLQFIPSELAQFAAGSRWIGGNENKAVLENDAQIYMGYCQNDADIAQHMGVEFDDVLFEEAVHFLPRAITDISTSDRGAGTSREARMVMGMPNTGRSRYLTNPGGRAMTVLEDFCITREPDRIEYPHYDPQFYGHIHGDIRDNPYLAEDYKTATLGGLDSKRFEQLAEGRWDVFPGQFFPDWQEAHTGNLDAQIVNAPRVAVVVWGYNRPGYVLWASLLPNGRVYLTDEWKFSGLTVPDVAATLKARHDGQPVRMLADVSLDTKPQPDTVTVESTRAVFSRHGLPLQLIDSAETHGWQRVHDYLRPATDSRPWLVASPRCAYLKRSLPTLIADEKEPDDLATGQDDRAALALRTLLASWPAPGSQKAQREPPAYMTLGWFKSLDAKTDAAYGPLRRHG